MSKVRGKKKKKMIEDYFELRQEINELNEKSEKLKEEIDLSFDFGEFETDYHIAKISQKERSFLDQDKVAKLLKNRIARCYSSTPYTSIRVTVKKEAS